MTTATGRRSQPGPRYEVVLVDRVRKALAALHPEARQRVCAKLEALAGTASNVTSKTTQKGQPMCDLVLTALPMVVVGPLLFLGIWLVSPLLDTMDWPLVGFLGMAVLMRRWAALARMNGTPGSATRCGGGSSRAEN